jgi:FtsH-binding integral membrane protein
LKNTIDQPDKLKQTAGLESVVIWAAALSMAVGAAFLASLKQVNPSIEFHFSAATVAAFVLGGLFTLVSFRVILNRGAGGGADDKIRRRWLLLFSAVASLAMFASFAIALRNLSPEKRSEVLGGTAIAVAVLTLFGWLFWKTVRFFDPDAAGTGSSESKEEKDQDSGQ